MISSFALKYDVHNVLFKKKSEYVHSLRSEY